MTEYVLRVSRNIMAPDRAARVQSEYLNVNTTMALSDDARWQMPGESVAYFKADIEGKKIKLFKRVPDPNWGQDFNI